MVAAHPLFTTGYAPPETRASISLDGGAAYPLFVPNREADKKDHKTVDCDPGRCLLQHARDDRKLLSNSLSLDGFAR